MANTLIPSFCAAAVGLAVFAPPPQEARAFCTPASVMQTEGGGGQVRGDCDPGRRREPGCDCLRGEQPSALTPEARRREAPARGRFAKGFARKKRCSWRPVLWGARWTCAF